jgi:ABC-type lipoprotein release transport system permease subunit
VRGSGCNSPEIDRELKSHLEMRIADNVAAGMSPEQARRDAFIRFGNRTEIRERVTAADAQLTFDTIWRELRYAARQLRGLAFALFPVRVATATLGVMGFLAAMLAVTGVFGIAMYSVSKRMKEFGIRVALGAQPVQLMRSALGRPLILLLFGISRKLAPGRDCQPIVGTNRVSGHAS